MKTTLAVILLYGLSLTATAAEPSDASIEKLMTLTKAESLVDSIYGNMEQNIRLEMTRAVAGKQLTDEQRRVIDSAPKKIVEMMEQELSRSDLKLMFIKLYKENFDQDDIDGLNDFYGSKAGQALVTKMPIVTHRSTVLAEERIGPLLVKISEAMKAALAEAKVAN